MMTPFLKFFLDEASPLLPEAEIQQFKALSVEQLLSKLAAGAVQFGINLCIALVVFVIGKFIVDRIYNFVSQFCSGAMSIVRSPRSFFRSSGLYSISSF